MTTTECSVCYENYEQDGEKCPKLLPCSHTVCLRCLRHIGQSFYMRCPECRKSHRVPIEGASVFPTNRYILENLALAERAAELEASPESTAPLLDETITGNELLICDTHNLTCILFCSNVQCREWLCPECPIQNHSNHNLVALRQENVRANVNDEANAGNGDTNQDDDTNEHIDVIEHTPEVFIVTDEESGVGNDTLSETHIDIARSIGDSIARATDDNIVNGAEAVEETITEDRPGNNEESLQETEGMTNESTEDTDIPYQAVIQIVTPPRRLEANRDLADSAENENFRETENDVEQGLQNTHNNDSTNHPKKHKSKCARCLFVFWTVLGYFLGVICVICLGAVVTVGVIATYVAYIVCCIIYHIFEGICNVDNSSKECCYCVGDIRDRFKRCRDRIESFFRKCKDCTEKCFSSCGGCHYTMLSVVCSLVLYFVIGVVAVVAVVVTGVVLIAAVPILICTLIVTYCVCKVMEKS